MIIPSIDLMDGKVVQLEQGKKKKLEIKESPEKFAEKFSSFGQVQLIDLDAAMGKGDNSAVVGRICRIVNARVGGGIRTAEKAKELVELGAKKVIIGTKASPEFLQELCGAIGKEKIVVALDSWKGEIVVKGWTEKTGVKVEEKVRELEPFCAEFFFTFVETEGTMKGVDFGRVKDLKKLTGNKISIGGGISSIEEAKELEKLGVDSVLGMALYTGKIRLEGVSIEL
ncbi:MAG: HisA/HisF-related TIM barrel protein [Candidatus Diapherotrites archaeon]